MKKVTLRRLLSFVLVMVLGLGINLNLTKAGTEKDVTALLTNINASITPDPTGSGNPLNSTQVVNVDMSFSVPVIGDGINDASQRVELGDTASFPVATGFVLSNPQNTYNFSMNGVKVGTLSFTNEDNAGVNQLMANIVFDGSPSVFNGVDDGDGIWSNVQCSLNFNLVFDNSNDYPDGSTQNASILDKNLEVNIPVVPTTVTGSKKGTKTNDQIDWVITVTAKKNDANASLEGMHFTDDLSTVGTFVAGSFKVGNSSSIANATSIPDASCLSGTNLDYTFPSGAKGTKYVFFSTKIPAENLNQEKTVLTNVAKIVKGGTELASFTGNINKSNDWIKKEAASVNPDGTIVWNITINPLKRDITGVKIKDELDSKLDFVSASYKFYDISTGNWVNGTSITPVDSIYTFGHVNTSVLLQITTKIKDTYNIALTKQHISNQAYLLWNEGPGVGVPSSSVGVDIGTNVLKKSVIDYYPSKGTIDWKVDVEKSNPGVDLKVIELLAYTTDATTFSNQLQNGFTVEDASGVETHAFDHIISTQDFTNRISRTYQISYVENSFTALNGSSLELHPYTIKVNGTAVADLLIVTGTGNTAIDPSSQTQSFSIETRINNPWYYMSNASTNIVNYANLYSANIKISNEQANKMCQSHTMNKDVVSRNSLANINALTSTSSADEILSAFTSTEGTSATAFDYKTKEVIYRLHVNANGVVIPEGGLTTPGGYELKDLYVSDVLPLGGKYKTILGNDKFVIFKGTASGINVTPTERITGAALDELLTVETTSQTADAGEGIRFNFKKLDGPYIIYLKATVNDEMLAAFFESPQTITVSNTGYLNSPGFEALASDYEDITVESKTLEKDMTHIEDGVVKWNITYQPYDINLPLVGSKVSDTLPEGVELRVNSNGEPIIAANGDTYLRINKMDLQADGTYTMGDEVPVEIGTNVAYDPVSRKLYFTLADITQAYNFQYVTDITAKAGTTLINNVEIVTSDNSTVSVNDTYVAVAADAYATMSRSGYVTVIKTNAAGDLLDNAIFALYGSKNVDGTPVIDTSKIVRTGSTVDGKVTLMGIPDGDFFLREYTAPNNYILSTETHLVNVTHNNGKIVVTIDGENVQNNQITVVNQRKGSLFIQKLAGDTGLELSNAVFKITDLSGNTVADTTGNPAIFITTSALSSISLADGNYILVETDAPVGYELAEPIKFSMENGIAKDSTNTIYDDNIIVVTDQPSEDEDESNDDSESSSDEDPDETPESIPPTTEETESETEIETPTETTFIIIETTSDNPSSEEITTETTENSSEDSTDGPGTGDSPAYLIWLYVLLSISGGVAIVAINSKKFVRKHLK